MDNFERWLFEYLEIQRKSDYKNHMQVALAVEYIIRRYQKYLKEKKNATNNYTTM